MLYSLIFTVLTNLCLVCSSVLLKCLITNELLLLLFNEFKEFNEVVMFFVFFVEGVANVVFFVFFVVDDVLELKFVIYLDKVGGS